MKQKEKLTLQAEDRTQFGKQLRKMRHNGKIPANVYGHDFKSLAITIDFKDFMHAYKVAHETGVVYVKTATQEVPTLIKHLQKHPVSDAIIHVDFRKINLSEKIETEVPFEFINESPAVAQLGGQLLTSADVVLIEALPNDIPENIQIDLAILTEIGSEIRLQDIAKIANVEFKDDPEKIIVSVVARKEESITPETETEAPEITTEKKEGEEGAAETSEAPADADKEKEEEKS